MKIYTKTGDAGETGLLGGARVAKDDPRIEATGTVDELNAAIGLVRCSELPAQLDSALQQIQDDLFALGAQLSAFGTTKSAAASATAIGLDQASVQRLEATIDSLEESLPPLKNFILPAGAVSSVHLHAARGTCRRAERRVVAIRQVDSTAGLELPICYLNRLSDLLFVMARAANQAVGTADVIWRPAGQP